MINRSGQRHLFLLICLALALGILFGYAPVLHHDFVNLDDPDYVSENPNVQPPLTVHKLAWAFTSAHAANWHPVTWLSHMFDCAVYGLNPGGHHLTNLLLHLANTLLLFALLRRMTGALWRSAIVAALFAWHPVHVESVAWISERKDVLSGFFGLLAIWGYVEYAGNLKWRKAWYAAALVLFALGLMSKPMLVTLPFVLLLIDCWPLQRLTGLSALRPLLVEKIPFFLLALLSSIITFSAQSEAGAVISLGDLTFSQRIANAVVSYIRYLGKMIWPAHLTIFYPIPDHWPLWEAGGAVALLVIITISVAALRRQYPYALVGWLWFLGMLVPVIGFVHVGFQAMADRYTYLPSIGIFIVAVWGLGDLASHWPVSARRLLPVLTSSILVVCLVLTRLQVRVWHDSITLFTHAAEAGSDRVYAFEHLGQSYLKLNRLDDAAAQFKAASELAPHSPKPLFYLGYICAREGSNSVAMQFLQKALANDPDYSPAHFEVANLLANQGKLTEAVAEYRDSIRLYPRAIEARQNLIKVLLQLGSYQEAAGELRALLRLDPDNAQTHDQLAGVLQKLGQPREAQTEYAEALDLDPNFIHAHLKLGLLLGQAGQFEEARKHFAQALAIEPTNDVALYNLGGLYAAQGNLANAASAFYQAARIKPADPDIRLRLGLVLMRAGKFTEAIAQLEQARDLTQAGDPAVLSLLDEAYAEAGRFPEAIQTAENARQLAIAQQKTSVADAAARRLEAYRAGKPYRE